jgi:hypothetical protein
VVALFAHHRAYFGIIHSSSAIAEWTVVSKNKYPMSVQVKLQPKNPCPTANSASDMAARLTDIKKDIPPEQQATWLEANHKAGQRGRTGLY